MMFRDRFDDDEDDESKGSEITLGLGSLLGIFFGLVLLCGLFFGFGYSLGHGSSPLHVTNPSAATPETPPSTPATSNLTPSGAKPAAQQAAPPPSQTTNGVNGTPDTTPAAGSQPGTQANPQSSAQTPATPQSQATPAPQQAANTSPAPQNQTVTPGAAQQIFQAAVPRTPSQVAASAQQYMVQVAAVSRPQDASVLVAALQRLGFRAVTRSEPQDNLMHVQIGPFVTLASANQMRARLRADGYNAILKP
ncbi:MAG: SPOR domain-containing protein [Acidobacteria bacterium]|jgi:cell division protein FtsN|nr:SPOR domain-containing protein [Acidobacteriota bacterium]